MRACVRMRVRRARACGEWCDVPEFRIRSPTWKKDGPLSLDSGDILAMLVGRRRIIGRWLERARISRAVGKQCALCVRAAMASVGKMITV